jgi:hypothetical protein
MRTGHDPGTVSGMTDTVTPAVLASSGPPLSRAVRVTAGLCLVAGAVLCAVPQLAERLVAGDLARADQIEWGLAHQGFYRTEWLTAMVGGFLLLFGFLGLWQITRWSAPRLTALGAVVLTWGMSGQVFSDTATYVAQVVAADTEGAPGAERLIRQGYLHDPGMIAVVLVPVIAGMFVGLLLLAVALWRSGFPRVPVVLLALWPLWDFIGPSRLGPVTADLFLLLAGSWLGLLVSRLPHGRWLGHDT